MNKQTRLLGLDVEGQLVLTDLEKEGQALICRDVAILPADDPTVYLVEFERVVRERGWTGRCVAISIPSQQVILRHLTLPTMPTASLRFAIENAIENRLHLPVVDPVFDFHAVPKSQSLSHDIRDAGNEGRRFWRGMGRNRARTTSKELDVLVAIAPRKEVVRWAQFAEQAGLRPIAAEPSLVAVARALDYSSNSMKETKLLTEVKLNTQGISVILMLGSDGVEFGLVQSGVVTFMRHIELTSPEVPAASATDHDMFQAAAGVRLNYRGQMDAYLAEVSYELDKSLSFVQYNVLSAEQRINGIFIVDKLNIGHEIAVALQATIDVPVRMAPYVYSLGNLVEHGHRDVRAIPHLVSVANGVAMGVMA